MANNNQWLLYVGVVAVGYLLLFGNPLAAEEPTTTPPTDGSVAGCNIEDISFTPKAVRLGKEGTTVADNYYIITDNLGATLMTTAATVPTNYAMTVMFAENSTIYYTVVKDINTDCQDPQYVSVKLPYVETSLNTFYVENADGTVNSASNAQAMGADDVFETTVYMKAGSDTYFGNPTSDCHNIGVVEYDKTYILQVEGDDPVAVPGAFSYNSTVYDGSAGFKIPKTGDGEKVNFNIKITSTGTEPDGTNNPILVLFDCDVDKNEDTLELIHGVQDEDLNRLSIGWQNKSITLS